MNTRGRQTHPQHQRYYAAGKGRSLYLLEAGDIIKIGTSKSVAHRLVQLHREFALAGAQIGRFATLTPSRQKGERDCIEVLSHFAHPLERRLEYFHGISFAAALGLVSEVLGATSVRVFPALDDSSASVSATRASSRTDSPARARRALLPPRLAGDFEPPG